MDRYTMEQNVIALMNGGGSVPSFNDGIIGTYGGRDVHRVTYVYDVSDSGLSLEDGTTSKSYDFELYNDIDIVLNYNAIFEYYLNDTIGDLVKNYSQLPKYVGNILIDSTYEIPLYLNMSMVNSTKLTKNNKIEFRIDGLVNSYSDFEDMTELSSLIDDASFQKVYVTIDYIKKTN